jgi:hypothetical protein
MAPRGLNLQLKKVIGFLQAQIETHHPTMKLTKAWFLGSENNSQKNYSSSFLYTLIGQTLSGKSLKE